jgi:hypothetical protein
VETADGESKMILTRPRDQIAAVRALQKIARDGIIPKGSLVLQQNDNHHRLDLSLGSTSRG